MPDLLRVIKNPIIINKVLIETTNPQILVWNISLTIIQTIETNENAKLAI